MASERHITVGGVQIGGGAPVVVQSMTLTKTHDVEATTAQIAALASAGCEIVRVAVPKNEDAEALGRIVRFSPVPVIADIHFNASLALKAIAPASRQCGSTRATSAARTRSRRSCVPRRPRGSRSHRRELGLAAETPRRARAAGPGGGSGRGRARGGAAAREPRLPGLQDLCEVQPRSDHDPGVPPLASKVPYPLHLGVTEAGTPFAGSIKSSVGMGALLVDGIGDTMRVSLTADPVEEVRVAFEILKALGLRERGPIMIACPSCGRDNVGVQTLAESVEERLSRTRSTSRSPCSAAR